MPDDRKRWPRVCRPLETPAKLNGTVSPSKVQRMECSGRTQRVATPGFQRMLFGQGSLAITSGMISASTAAVSRPSRSITAT